MKTEQLDLGQLFNASPNAYVIFDKSLRIVACNQSYLSVVGRDSASDIIGEYLFDAFPSPEDSASYKLLHRSLKSVLEEERRDHLAIIPYDTSRPGEPSNMRYWSATHTPIFGSGGELEYILQHTVDISELQKLRERDARGMIAEAGVLHRANRVQANNWAMSAESRFMRDTFKQAPGFMCVLAGPAHNFIMANDAYIELLGGRDPVGRAAADAIPELVEQGFIDLLNRVYRTGEPYIGSELALTLEQPNADETRKRYLDFIFQPLYSEDGTVNGIFVQGHDVTDRIEAKRLELLRNRELGHRLKNQLSVIQAIVNQTLRSSKELDKAGPLISERLSALAKAHEILIVNELGKTTVGEVVEQTKSIFDDDRFQRFHATGPDITVGARPAISLALLLHELSTNAVKHGALSNENGVVNVEWGTRTGDDGDLFVLEWREEGGPPVSSPGAFGAGTSLIRAGLAGTLHCKVDLEFAATGLLCHVTADLESFSGEGDAVSD